MATKKVELPDIGEVTLYKRRGSRSIRLSIAPTGQIRVTMPTWVPYVAAIDFVRQKSDWLASQKQPVKNLEHGSQIGRRHKLFFKPSSVPKPAVRTRDQIITVTIPAGSSPDSAEAQKAAKNAGVRALKAEAEDYLPNRVRELADTYGFKVRSIEVKRLRSRWGSCNHKKEIVLNCFLMQLPWELIDYVILHELNHTNIMAHGPKFWQELAKYVPDLPAIRKQMKTHRPELQAVVNTSGV